MLYITSSTPTLRYLIANCRNSLPFAKRKKSKNPNLWKKKNCIHFFEIACILVQEELVNNPHFFYYTLSVL